MHEPPENMQDEPNSMLEQEAGQSFAVPAELAGEYTHGTLSPQNSVDPSVPPPRSDAVDEIIEATTGASRRLRARIGHYGPHHVAAIAAQLAAEFPGMFAGPDVLGPVRVPPPVLPSIDDRAQATVDRLMHERLERGITRQIAAEAHVIVDSSPSRRSASFAFQKPRRMGKPAGSKLARKAARGKL